MEENLHSEHRERVRKEFFERGFGDETSPHKVLEMLLFYAIPRKDTNEIAHLLIKRFGSIFNVINASPEELMKIKGIGPNTAGLIKLMLPVIRAYDYERFKNKKKYNSIDEIGDYLLMKYTGFTKETVSVMTFDNKGSLLGLDKVAEGDLGSVTVSVRTIVETVFKYNASCFILVHNHPGGQATPSPEDIRMTAYLSESLRKLGVIMLDHFILCDDDYVSLSISQQFKHMFRA